MASYQISGTLLLRGIGVVYFIAFASLFVQIPGLFGCDGLEPVDVYLSRMETHWATNSGIEEGMSGALQRFSMLPSLLWFTREVSEWGSEAWMDLACLCGMTLSALVAGGLQWRSPLICLYVLYLSMFQVGQTFLSFQWDILLLEAGLLAILLAPFPRPARASKQGNGVIGSLENVFAPPAMIGMQLLLFKLMLLSGVVKINNGGHWFKMTAMAYHYATTCLPTPLAYFFHELPGIGHEAEVALCLFVEIPATLLLILPLPKLWRATGVMVQLSLQVLIQLTGNYTFFNILTALLCLSCIDDSLWASFGIGGDTVGGENKTSGWVKRWVGHLFQLVVMYMVFTGILSKTLGLDVSGQSPGQLVAKLAAAIMPDQPTTWRELLPLVHLRLAFGTAQLQRFLNLSIPLLLLVIAALFALAVARFLLDTARQRGHIVQYLRACAYAVFIVGAVTFVFVGNVPNYTRLTSGPALSSSKECSSPLTSLECASTTLYHAFDQPWFADANARLRPWAGASSYGLFRSMTGVGSKGDVARPELVVEGFDGTRWLPYEFLYKPGDLSRPPPWVAPHQPRMDWQMWFAALGTYQRNPWLLHWVYKLLVHSPTSRGLIDAENSPFADTPPRSVRIKKYEYDFVQDELSRAVNEKHRDWTFKKGVQEGTWWRRHYVGEWLQPVEVSNLKQFVSSNGYPLDPSSECIGRGLPGQLGDICDHLRSHTLTVSLAIAGIIVLNTIIGLFRCLW